ncbi:hypothetical protein K438DRAFT_1755491 [Mycena galopus ATCC 62051]|nr:hypothetical protein K438DRAFT_1755491 [Mycena galopus ATCC 62051]
MKPLATDEIYMRKKVSFNPPPSGASALVSDLVPLQIHLMTRITRASVERLEFIRALSRPVVAKRGSLLLWDASDIAYGNSSDEPVELSKGLAHTNLLKSLRSDKGSERSDGNRKISGVHDVIIRHGKVTGHNEFKFPGKFGSVGHLLSGSLIGESQIGNIIPQFGLFC